MESHSRLLLVVETFYSYILLHAKQVFILLAPYVRQLLYIYRHGCAFVNIHHIKYKDYIKTCTFSNRRNVVFIWHYKIN